MDWELTLSYLSYSYTGKRAKFFYFVREKELYLTAIQDVIGERKLSFHWVRLVN